MHAAWASALIWRWLRRASPWRWLRSCCVASTHRAHPLHLQRLIGPTGPEQLLGDFLQRTVWLIGSCQQQQQQQHRHKEQFPWQPGSSEGRMSFNGRLRWLRTSQNHHTRSHVCVSVLWPSEKYTSVNPQLWATRALSEQQHEAALLRLFPGVLISTSTGTPTLPQLPPLALLNNNPLSALMQPSAAFWCSRCQKSSFVFNLFSPSFH